MLEPAMPTRFEIQKEIVDRKSMSQDDVRRRYLKDLADYTRRDTILYASAFSLTMKPGIPGVTMAVSLDDIQSMMSAVHGLRNENLDIVLHSPGGSMEATEQIVSYLRAKYRHIRAIIPQNAMSAATMLACACDEIVMGKHSAIGPIDPQVTFPTPHGAFTAPAQAVLNEFEQAKAEIAQQPATAPLWVTKFNAYPHGFLAMCRATLDLAEERVAKWLESYMFAGDDGGGELASEIATWLGAAKTHKTHGRPFSADLAKSKGLKIVSLEDDQDLQERVLSVFHAAMVTFIVSNCVKIVENHMGRGAYSQVEVQQQRSF
jgi:hypothetical protein